MSSVAVFEAAIR